MHLNDKWELLKSREIKSGYNTVRFEAEIPLEIFLAVDEFKTHIVLIHLPPSYIPEIDVLKNDNLELVFLKDNNCLLIKLLDQEYISLFDDLVVSLVESIKGLSDVVEASKIFISTYVKWNVFFMKSSERGLSKERIIGLWGELSYLLHLLQTAGPIPNVNKILKSWVGPYDAAHDFEFPDMSIEVKTKLFNSTAIKISSEYQLEESENKSLELAVLSVVEDEGGLTMKDLFLLIKDIILNNNGDFVLLLTTLEKETLNEERLSKFSDFKFSRKKLETFDCCKIGFPKITKSELAESISEVKYSLDVKHLAEYCFSLECY